MSVIESNASRIPSINVPLQNLESLCGRLEELSESLDAYEAWPSAQFQLLAAAGVLGWVIPAQHGGSEVSTLDLTIGYEALASACLTTAFVLTQRNGACQRIAACENDDLKSDLLPALARGDLFATVGISHLTTSRQHLGRPSVHLKSAGDDFIAEGTVPWVTGAKHAEYIVTGGTCDDGRQVLFALPTGSSGVTLQPAPRLLALNGSQTGSVELQEVKIERGMILAGPMEGVMKRGRGGSTGGLATSALALGCTNGVLKKLAAEAERRDELLPIHSALEAERSALSDDIRRAVSTDNANGDAGLDAEGIRGRANSLVLRSSQAFLAASKGAGFVTSHPAERAVREAMFFLVWSCPQPVLSAALEGFACILE